jgi:hypothetical protein
VGGVRATCAAADKSRAARAPPRTHASACAALGASPAAA